MRVELEDVKGVRCQCARGQFGNYYVSSAAVVSCGLFGMLCRVEGYP